MRQDDALALLQQGHNIFLTGAAGAGKTFLLNRYIGELRAHRVGVAVTASTGIAATHLGGQTIHAWSGIGVRDSLTQDDLDKIAKNSSVKKHFRDTQVLVIDEISMLHAHQLDMVDAVARRMREGSKPFGGLQVIVCGDFFQLPPVTGPDLKFSGVRFAYEAQSWKQGELRVCYLNESHRHGDPVLLEILNDIRNGAAGEHTKVPLRTRYKKPPVGVAGVRPTRLYARNINVDSINQKELEALPGKARQFRMESRGFSQYVDGLKRSCLAPEALALKPGAEVMFVKNDAEGRFVNGTRGRISGFDGDTNLPLVLTQAGETIAVEPAEWRSEEDGFVRASIKQLPLRLAWAITIHKSQGMTLDAAELDLSDAFEPGMGYVALSRVRTLGGLTLLGLNEVALTVHPKILGEDRHFRQQSKMAEAELATLSESERKVWADQVLFERFGGTRERMLVDPNEPKKPRRPREKIAKQATHEISGDMLARGLSLADIAEERGLTVGTIIGHVEKLKSADPALDLSRLKNDIAEFDAIRAAWAASEDGKLGPIFAQFNGQHSYDTLRLVRLLMS